MEANAEATTKLEKAIRATRVIEQTIAQNLAGDFDPYVYAATKFERYDGNTDTATISVTVDVEDVDGFLKKFAPWLLK